MGRSKDLHKTGKMADSMRLSPKSPRSPKSENIICENSGNKENATLAKVLEPIKEEKSDSDSKRSALAALNAEIQPVSLEEEKKKASINEESVAEPKEETPLQVEETSSKSPVDERTTQQEQHPQIRPDVDEHSATTEQQPSEIVTEESSNNRRDLKTDAFGELVEVSESRFGNFFVKLSNGSFCLPRSVMLSSVMETNGENKLQQRYYKYRAKKVAEYCIHPVMDKNRQEKRICVLCAEGYPGQDFNISKKLLEEDVPDYVLEMLVKPEDVEKEIKNKTNQLYQQHVLVNGFMAKLFGQSLGKSEKFCANKGKEELEKLYKLAKAYTLIVDVIHSLVTDNSLESWWQAFGALQENDEPSLVDQPVDDEIDVQDPLSESKDCVDQSNGYDEEILQNRKEFDSMKVKLGEKVFERKGILSKNAEPSNFSVKFSDRSEKCIGTSM